MAALIQLNGEAGNARAIAADLRISPEGSGDGWVVAEWTEGQFVTWAVSISKGDLKWAAFWGHYFTDQSTAENDYDKRRGVTK